MEQQAFENLSEGNDDNREIKLREYHWRGAGSQYSDITIRAYLSDGKLVIEGQEFSDDAEAIFGGDEIEYWYSFDEGNTAKLFSKLNAEIGKELSCLRMLFPDDGYASCEKLRVFCEANDIKYEFALYA
jgi:hypothetical protein